MKKLNRKGFILAETLVVSVFLMVMFTMIYSNFFPIIGEYEKRENYDDVDGKYTAYWIKKMIESDGYNLDSVSASGRRRIIMMNKWGYIRFECSDVSVENNQQEVCKNLVNSLEISNCDSSGNGCDIYITRYTIGNDTNSPPSFKDTIRGTYTNQSIKRWNEYCAGNSNPFDVASATNSNSACATAAFQECCRQKGLLTCTNPALGGTTDYETLYSDSVKTPDYDNIAKYCNNLLTRKAFVSSTRDYVLSLPNYTIPHTSTGAKYRVIVVVRHRKDNNDYYSFSTMEVIK